MDYRTLLGVLKVVSEGLTAGFGILGLLSEFKDKQNKVTKTGKIALSGIIVGFIVSGMITVFENANARAEDRAHEQEIRRLSRPLADLIIQTAYFLPYENLSSDFAKLMRSLHGVETKNHHFPSSDQLPTDVRERVSKLEDDSDETVGLYRHASCEDIVDNPRSPDLIARSPRESEQDQEERWEYWPEVPALSMQRRVKLQMSATDGKITSVEDILGSTLVIWPPIRLRWNHIKINYFVFIPTLGVTYQIDGDAFRKVTIGAPGEMLGGPPGTDLGRFGYCYTFSPQP